MASQFQTNILILGKSGVGKSSLLNYLFGKDVSPIGHGKPTTTKGIHQHPPFENNGVSFCIHDSWGLEDDKADTWKKLIEDEVKKNGAQGPRDWFHTILYCVDAERARVDDFEINAVLHPLLASGNRVLFALTKAGLNENNTKETAAVLKEKFPVCEQVEVESVSAELFTRSVTQKGREELLEKLCHNLQDNIIFKSICRYEAETIQAIRDKFTSGVLRYFDEHSSLVAHHGEGFRKKIIEFASESVRNILSDNEKKLKEHIENGSLLSSTVSNSFQPYEGNHKKITIPPLNMNWDNSFSDYAGTIIAVILVPGGFFVRGSVVRDDIKKACIKCNDDIEKQIKQRCDELCNKFNVPRNKAVNKNLYDIYLHRFLNK